LVPYGFVLKVNFGQKFTRQGRGKLDEKAKKSFYLLKDVINKYLVKVSCNRFIAVFCPFTGKVEEASGNRSSGSPKLPGESGYFCANRPTLPGESGFFCANRLKHLEALGNPLDFPQKV
jgi:hypothetical protein